MALPDPAIACSHADLVRKLTTENITSLITICEKEKKYIYIHIRIFTNWQFHYLVCRTTDTRIPPDGMPRIVSRVEDIDS